MEPIEALLAAITALNGIKKLFFETNSQIERRRLKEKQRELEREINRLKSKIIKLETRKGGRFILICFYRNLRADSQTAVIVCTHGIK